MASRKRRLSGRIAALVIVLAAAALAVHRYGSGLWGGSGKRGVELPLTVPVTEGPLVISVIEAGTVKPSEQTVLKSLVEGRSTILYLIPEGRQVQAGELLVELDASKLMDDRVDQEIRVRNAEASFVQSRENLEVVKNQARADVEKATLNLRFAREDLRKYEEGEYPNQQKELKSKINMAEEEVQRTGDKLKWSRQLFAEKYLSETELKADELAAMKAELDLELARSRLQLLQEYTYKREVDRLTSDVAQFEMALERTERRTAADLVQAEAQLQAREVEFVRQKDKLQKLGEQIVKAKIVAPTAGTVVYATSAQMSWRGNVEPLAEGQEVHERQEIIHLPVSDTFVATVKVHESSLQKIYPGLPVRVTVDALPGRSFTGKVSRIAPLPDPQSMFMNPDLKVFTTDIAIDGGGDVLRTGMTCEVEIVVARYEKAMQLPVQCVVRVGGQPTVYVLAGTAVVPKPVEIGLDNNQMVHVISGLTVGEQVVLTPPLGASGAGSARTPVGDVEIPPRPADNNAVGRSPRASPAGDDSRPRRPAEDAASAPAAGSPAGTQPGGVAAAAATDAAGGEQTGETPRRGPRPEMTPEERQRMRERFESMTPEEREAARRQFGSRGREGGGRPGGASQGGGAGAPPTGGGE